MQDNVHNLQFLQHSERLLGSLPGAKGVGLPSMPPPPDARVPAVKFAEIVDLLKANQQIVV